MKLNEIRRPAGYRKEKGRLGRGPGSGTGKTAGRGAKGQRSRSGSKIRPWFEGGQMPINRRVPKRGFRNLFAKNYQVINLRDLERMGEATEITPTSLHEHGLVGNPRKPVKLLGDGEVSRAYSVRVDRASASAVKAIEAAGGKVELEDVKRRR